jgi:UDP:flavonoid glycosyltransferase YjiC (YdhE family)
MSRFLLVTWDGGGNVPPMLSVGRELRDRGHEVLVLGHGNQADEVDELDFVAYKHGLPWSSITPRSDPLAPFKLFVDGGTGEDVREVLSQWPADAIVCDCLMLGALQAAGQSGLPTVALMHTWWGFFGEHFPHAPVTELGEAVGRPPLPLWNAATAVIVTADRQLDPVVNTVPPNVTWTGVAQPTVQPAAKHDRRRGLLSLSTVWFSGQQESIQAVLDGLGHAPVTMIATIADSISTAGLRIPTNVEVRGYTPHTHVMSEVAFVIGHGGHATTMLALAHDLPVIVVPQLEIDQPLIGSTLQSLGAGLLLDQHPTPEQVTEAVTAVVGNESFHAAAAKIGRRLRATDGAANAADEIEALVPTSVGA